MQIIDFLNSRNIGKTRSTSIDSTFWRPNLDDLLTRFICREKDVYVNTFESDCVPPFACKFRKDIQRDLLAVANEDGDIQLINTDNNEGLLHTFTAHQNAIFDICWLPDKHRLITVSGDHSACLWDMNTCKMISKFRNHCESVKSVDACRDNTDLFATGSKDGTICLWDTRDKCHECGNSKEKPSIWIKSAHFKKSSLPCRGKRQPSHNPALSGVASVAFQDQINLASAGNSDGVLKIWDLRKTYISKPSYIPCPRYQMKYGNPNGLGHGCTSLVFDSIRKTLYGCSTSHKIYKFDCHKYSDAVVTYEGFRCRTYFVKMDLSPDDQYLLSGSSDCKAYVWKTTEPGIPILTLPGHTSEVTAVAWSSIDATKLVTCGDDSKVLVWKPANVENIELQEHIVARSSPVFKGVSELIHENHPLHRSLIETETSSQSSSAVNNASSNQMISLSHPSLPVNKNSSHPTLKTSIIKSIKSFFHPLTTPTSPTSDSSSHKKDIDSNITISPKQVLSPSKVLNQNTSFSPDSNPKSPKKIPQKSLFSKENCDGQSSSGNSNGQKKRKSTSGESTPKFQKTASKGKRKSQNAAKQPNPSGAITNYFKLSLSSDE